MSMKQNELVFFFKLKKIDKTLARLSEQAREEEGKTQINEIRDESQGISSKYFLKNGKAKRNGLISNHI